MKIYGLALFLFWITPAWAAELRIAAASDLQFALKEISAAYEKAHPQEKISLTFGASGKFLTQIQNGAPFGLFFSADTDKAQSLVDSKITEGEAFPYARGHLVLWALADSNISLDAKLTVLVSEGVKKIAIANPTTAPYGTIAEQALKKAGLSPALRLKLVVGENISQAAQFVESGAASVGLIARSLAESPHLRDKGKFVEVDPSLYKPLLQSGVVLKGASQQSALRFKEFFLGAQGQAILKKFGLGL
jgi:molybdate transport system substrate-binding protein